MSTRSLSKIQGLPQSIKKIFRDADDPPTPETRLWRERAARMTLDALGYTNITVKPHDHEAVVKYARRWFKGIYCNLEDKKLDDHCVATFDSAGINFPDVKKIVLSLEPVRMKYSARKKRERTDDNPG